MTYEKVVELLKVCQGMGIRRIKIAGVEAEFGGDGPLPLNQGFITYDKAIRDFKEDPDKNMPSDSEMLGWSTSLELAPEKK